MRKIKRAKMKVLSFILSLTLLMGIVPTSVFASALTDSWDNHAATTFAGGTGAQDDPYLISNAEELAYLAVLANDNALSRPNTENKHFKLTENIDLSEHRWIPIGRSGWNIPEYNGSFHGYFDGNNKTISGLYVDETATECFAGLFGKITGSRENQAPLVQNLTISEATIKSGVSNYESTYGGVLCGHFGTLSNSATNTFVKNIAVSGTIISSKENDKINVSGGLAGNAQQVTFDNCFANVTIKGAEGQVASNSGGLFGMASSCVVENSTTKGSISGSWAIGGIAAESYDSTFDNCIATIAIEGNDWRLGGFTGYSNNTSYTNCAAYGDVKSTATFSNVKTGGFIGEVSTGTLTDCYSTGKVSAMDNIVVGGFVGCVENTVSLSGGFNKDANSSLNAVGVNNGTLTDNTTAYTTAEIAQKIADNLTSAVAADYSIVDDAKAKALALNADEYKDFSKVTEAVNNIVTEKMLNEQYIVNGYAAAIEKSISELEYKDADYTKVDEAIEKANALNKDDYKDFSAVTTAINAVVRGKDITEQESVNLMAKAIEDAIKALELKPVAPPVSIPEIVEGANQTVKQDEDATFKSDAKFSDFQKVLVDGKEVHSNNYTVTEGSTIVTLKADFIKTLSVGKHTVSIVSVDGTASSEFTVTKAATPTPKPEKPDVPATGDTSNMILWIAVLLVSGGALTALTVTKKRKNSLLNKTI